MRRPLINVVSFSGGRTSAYLARLMMIRSKKTKFIFMDTGAEHPATYEFIREFVKHWKIDLICLRVIINPILGKGNGYKIINIDEIGPDLQPWMDMLKKYGTPYFKGEFCTDRMKLGPFKNYCDEHFGKKNYRTWIGIRQDEPKRLLKKPRTHYLAQLSDFGKEDVISWWSEQQFDLGIPEHLGNCVFCIKKSLNKIRLAARDEPELAKQFIQVLASDQVRIVKTRTSASLIMYRENNTLEDVIKENKKPEAA